MAQIVPAGTKLYLLGVKTSSVRAKACQHATHTRRGRKAISGGLGPTIAAFGNKRRWRMLSLGVQFFEPRS